MKISCFAVVLAFISLTLAVSKGGTAVTDVTFVHNDITNGQFCQVCKVGSDRACVTIQSGESAGLNTQHLRKGGYFVSCPIGLTRATDVERTILEGLLKLDAEPGKIIGLNAHMNTISKVNILPEGASAAEVMHVVNPKLASSLNSEDL